MDLYKDMLIRLLQEESVEVTFPNLQIEAKDFIEKKSYRTLCKIREILLNEEYSDEDCFEAIEKIICEFYELGSHCGFRHDDA